MSDEQGRLGKGKMAGAIPGGGRPRPDRFDDPMFRAGYSLGKKAGIHEGAQRWKRIIDVDSAGKQRVIWPLVVAMDRYDGLYSGGSWHAWELDAVPEGASGDDRECAEFWDHNELPFGLGATPQEAVEALAGALAEREGSGVCSAVP